MSLTTYCDIAEVRSSLGVNDLELKDTVLGLPVYELGLVRELNKISASLNAAFFGIRAKLAEDRTATEAALHDAVRVFAVYAVARQVGISLANFAPKEVGDGKATVSRFAGNPFENVMRGINEMYASLKADVRAAYEAFTGAASGFVGTAVPPVAFMASSRLYDPVAPD